MWKSIITTYKPPISEGDRNTMVKYGGITPNFYPHTGSEIKWIGKRNILFNNYNKRLGWQYMNFPLSIAVVRHKIY